MVRPEYVWIGTINGKKFSRIIIDQHYKEKHADTVNDQIILELVKKLDGQTMQVDEEQGRFQYFKVEPLMKDDQPYRLILLVEGTDDYLGVINAFRVDRRS